MSEIYKTVGRCRHIVDTLKEKHAIDIELYDLRELSSFADVFIVATARSEINMRSLRDAIEDDLEKSGIAYRIEGVDSRKWCLVDAGDIVVNIMSREGRGFYKFDLLWGDAPVERIENDD